MVTSSGKLKSVRGRQCWLPKHKKIANKGGVLMK